MPKLDEETGNQEVVDVEQVGDGSNDAGADAQEDFLVVNDRTKFRTAEDAIKSYNEAGERIKQLSAWEKELGGRYGVTDPRVAAELFEELKTLRAQQAEAAKKVESKPAAATQTDDDEGLSKEDAEALKWIKKHAPRLGYISKDELQSTVEALKTEIAALKTGNESTEQTIRESQRQTYIDSGRENVRSWMNEQKIVDSADGEKMLVIESLIRDWVNLDESRVARFYASASESKALIKEGFEKAVKVLGWGKSAANPGSNLTHAMDKGRALARNGKRMPQNGAASRASNGKDGSNVRVDAGGRKDHIGSAHDAAWAIAQKHFAGTSAE